MSKIKDKTQGFLLGLMVGLLVAGGFFVLKLDDYFKELNFYKTFVHTFTSESKTPEYVEKAKETTAFKTNEIKTNTVTVKSISHNDSSSTNSLNEGLVMDLDSLNMAKDTITDNYSNTDNIVVKKDEQLSSKTIEIINLNPVASRTNTKDSLLQKVSGIMDDKISGKQFVTIEFWQSPLNYKGYKMSKSKLVLYGMEPSEGIKLFKIDDVIYLKNQAMIYKLDYESDFKSYDHVTDESIINKLK